MNYFFVPFMAAILIGLDILTKRWALTTLSFTEPLWLLGPVNLHLVFNPGGAFGLFPGRVGILIVTSSAVIIGLLVYAWFNKSLWHRLGAGLVIGGSVGNLIDRIRCGAVVDFFDPGFFPVFNLADASIVTGLCCLCLALLREERTERGRSQCDQ